MSRRTAGTDRTAQNQQTLKSLVKLEGNKSCADCKRNKHPRWASWNLGIFICIRCSGIHRGMGTHISRVKSVDLDSWTDEQLQSMLRWGNSRANKYWEAELPKHLSVPAEARIEAFIRTKYDSKKWAMRGPMPDPSTLGGEGDDDVPLNVVQEKAKLDRSASLRNATTSSSSVPAPPKPAAPVIDLFGDDPGPPSSQNRASTTEPAIAARPPPPKAPVAAPPKQHRPGDSLLGLDFFGSSQSAPPARPASAASGVTSPGGNPRSDLKQSILSLYASAPKPAPVQTQPASNAFGGFASPPVQSPAAPTQSFGGLNDTFGGLGFSSPAPQQQPSKPAPFANLTSPASRSGSLSGGSFFDTKPAVPAKQPTAPAPAPRPQTDRASSGFGDFGDFASAPMPAPAPAAARSPPPAPASSAMGDLFGFGAPEPAKPAAPTTSAFNLSNPPAPKPAPAVSSLDNMDAWGSSNAWSTSEPAPPAAAPAYKAPATTSISTNDDEFGGWGSNEGTSSSKPAVTQDDEFGGWSSAPAPAPAAASTSTTRAGPTQDDLFGNVWG